MCGCHVTRVCHVAAGECHVEAEECYVAAGECYVAAGECYVAAGECYVVTGVARRWTTLMWVPMIVGGGSPIVYLASRDIQAGDELLTDYGSTYT